MKTNVFCYAKKDLKAGDSLDGMGGFASYGLIENIADQPTPGVPICLSENLKLKRDIVKDERITIDDVNLDKTDPAFSLYYKSLRL